MELKVESKSQTGAAFARLVKLDQKKLSAPLIDEYKGYDIGVYALAWGDETKAKLKEANMVEVRGSEIRLRSGSIVLFKWDGDLADPPAQSNPLDANVPLTNPQTQNLPMHNPSSSQTPGPAAESPTNPSTGKTPSEDDTNTPTKKKGGKMTGIINKLKPGSGSSKKGGGQGKAGGASRL